MDQILGILLDTVAHVSHVLRLLPFLQAKIGPSPSGIRLLLYKIYDCVNSKEIKLRKL